MGGAPGEKKTLSPRRDFNQEETMGDAADDILDGNVCESCGDWLGDGDGYPRKCGACARPKKKKETKK